MTGQCRSCGQRAIHVLVVDVFLLEYCTACLIETSRVPATPDAGRGVTASSSPDDGAPDGPGPAGALDPTFEVEVNRPSVAPSPESRASTSDPTFVPVFLDDTTDVLTVPSRPTRNITTKGNVL